MYILLQTDAFHDANTKADAQRKAAGTDRLVNVRRPYRGIQIKDDTYATLSVRRPDGSAIPLTSSSAVSGDDNAPGMVDDYSDFILQHIEDQRMEKQQIIETFGDTFIYFFGERPRVITLSGILMNTEDFNWRAQFWANYDKYLRGTKLVEQNARCYLSYDTVVIEGYVLSAGATDDGENPYSIPFNMSLILTNYFEYSSPGTRKFPRATVADDAPVNESTTRYVSTTAQVRDYNLTAGGPTGLLASVRGALRAVNDFSATVGGYIKMAGDVLSGRAMRLPVGIAGFVAQLQGQNYLAAGSIASTAQFNALTGKVDTEFNGLVLPGMKLLVAGPTGWVKPNILTGLFSDNYDEYPMRDGPSMMSAMGAKPYADWKARLAKAAATLESSNQALEVLANMEGGLLGDLAGYVRLGRDAFGLFVTVGNIVKDPVGTLSNMFLGITPNQILTVATMGVLSNSSAGGFNIGFSAAKSLAAIASSKFTNPVTALFNQKNVKDGAASLGEVYDSNQYSPPNPKAASDTTYAPPIPPGQPSTSETANQASVDEVYNANSYRSGTNVVKDVNYEAAYSNADYTNALAQAAQQDQSAAENTASAIAALSSENKQAIQSVLNSTYGDVDITTTERRASLVGQFQKPSDPAVDLVSLYGPGKRTAELIAEASPDAAALYGADIVALARQAAATVIAGGEVSPDVVAAIMSTVGTINRRKLTSDEMVALLQLVYGSSIANPQSDADQSGIQAADDESSYIASIA